METIEDATDAGSEGPAVSAHRTTPDRVVFTEEGNCDGWIASDLTVEPER
ncbi:MAG: hypothetical protein ABEH78_08695 [Haloferacaceae archaeon]